MEWKPKKPQARLASIFNHDDEVVDTNSSQIIY